jgi:hypothetical protein
MAEFLSGVIKTLSGRTVSETDALLSAVNKVPSANRTLCTKPVECNGRFTIEVLVEHDPNEVTSPGKTLSHRLSRSGLHVHVSSSPSTSKKETNLKTSNTNVPTLNTTTASSTTTPTSSHSSQASPLTQSLSHSALFSQSFEAESLTLVNGILKFYVGPNANHTQVDALALPPINVAAFIGVTHRETQGTEVGIITLHKPSTHHAEMSNLSNSASSVSFASSTVQSSPMLDNGVGTIRIIVHSLPSYNHHSFVELWQLLNARRLV